MHVSYDYKLYSENLDYMHSYSISLLYYYWHWKTALGPNFGLKWRCALSGFYTTVIGYISVISYRKSGQCTGGIYARQCAYAKIVIRNAIFWPNLGQNGSFQSQKMDVCKIAQRAGSWQRRASVESNLDRNRGTVRVWISDNFTISFPRSYMLDSTGSSIPTPDLHWTRRTVQSAYHGCSTSRGVV